MIFEFMQLIVIVIVIVVVIVVVIVIVIVLPVPNHQWSERRISSDRDQSIVPHKRKQKCKGEKKQLKQIQHVG